MHTFITTGIKPRKAAARCRAAVAAVAAICASAGESSQRSYPRVWVGASGWFTHRLVVYVIDMHKHVYVLNFI